MRACPDNCSLVFPPVARRLVWILVLPLALSGCATWLAPVADLFRLEEKVTLEWRTESETDNYGYNIMRSESPDGPFVKINPVIIAGHGTTNTPHEYKYIDKEVEAGKTYYYSLYSLSYDGEETCLGTIPHVVPDH